MSFSLSFSIYHDDYPGFDSNWQGSRRRPPTRSTDLRCAQPLRGLRLLIHVPALPALTRDAHLQQTANEHLGGHRLHPYTVLLRPAVLHSYILFRQLVVA